MKYCKIKKYSPAKLANSHIDVLRTEKPTSKPKLTRKCRLFSARYIYLQIGKLRKAIFSLFYNIRNQTWQFYVF